MPYFPLWCPFLLLMPSCPRSSHAKTITFLSFPLSPLDSEPFPLENASAYSNPSPPHLLIPSFAHQTHLNLDVIDAGTFSCPLTLATCPSHWCLPIMAGLDHSVPAFIFLNFPLNSMTQEGGNSTLYLTA